MIFPEKIDFFGISSPAKTPSNVWTNWCVWVSKRLSTEVSSGVQQFVSMELLYPITDNSSGIRIPFFCAYLILPIARDKYLT